MEDHSRLDNRTRPTEYRPYNAPGMADTKGEKIEFKKEDKSQESDSGLARQGVDDDYDESAADALLSIGGSRPIVAGEKRSHEKEGAEEEPKKTKKVHEEEEGETMDKDQQTSLALVAVAEKTEAPSAKPQDQPMEIDDKASQIEPQPLEERPSSPADHTAGSA
ncbi:hypothetical protein CLU79DRAFT_770381 [Phycomyces nitens]|nr:hypothetical protein CLU79DRAFT_770381 [Phycomyces nitens]